MKYLLVQSDGSIFASGDGSPEGAVATAAQVSARTGLALTLYTSPANLQRIDNTLVRLDAETGALTLKAGAAEPPGGLPYLGAAFTLNP